MSRLVVVHYVSVDGVMQGPGHPDEDRRGRFTHAGCRRPYADTVMGEVMGEGIARGESLLFGRVTYEKMASYWPVQPDDDPYAAVMSGRQKYVASRTLAEPLPWANSTVLNTDVATAVAELKERPGGDLVVLGSGELTQLLIEHDLIDEYVLAIHPLLLGSGRRLFADVAVRTNLRLVDSRATTTGVLIARYDR